MADSGRASRRGGTALPSTPRAPTASCDLRRGRLQHRRRRAHESRPTPPTALTTMRVPRATADRVPAGATSPPSLLHERKYTGGIGTLLRRYFWPPSGKLRVQGLAAVSPGGLLACFYELCFPIVFRIFFTMTDKETLLSYFTSF